MTTGRLAEELVVGRSGAHKHFDTEEAPQISTLDKAFADFWHRVVEPALRANSVGHPAEPLLPGGCLATAALSVSDGRPGTVRDAVAEVWSRRRGRLRTGLRRSVRSSGFSCRRGGRR